MTVELDYQPTATATDGTVLEFPISFPFLTAADITLQHVDAQGVTTAIDTQTYTVTRTSLDDPDAGGKATFAAIDAPPAGTVIATLTPPLTQSTPVGTFTKADWDAIEAIFDLSILLHKRARFEAGQTLSAPVADGELDMTLPAIAARAGGVLSFDEQGLPQMLAGLAGVPVSTFWAALLDDADSTALNALVIAAMLAADQDWTGSQRSPFVAANDGAIDFNAGQNFLVTPGASAGEVAITFASLADGQGGMIIIENTSGNASGFTWPVAADFGDQGTPTVGAVRARFWYTVEGARVEVGRA